MKYQDSAFTGQGAAEYGGRWNMRGTKMVYTSENQSLAALELLVHLNPPILPAYKVFRVEFEEKLVERVEIKELPKNWRDEPPGRSTQRLGSRWAEEGRSAVLAVPSAIIESEFNYLLNPAHRLFAKIKIGAGEAFSFDRRLL